MKVVQWIWAEIGEGDIATSVLYYILRGLMFILSFVLEDWALHELVQSPRRRVKFVVALVASSYVTWTYQTHTFSNSIETLVVLWTLVMIHRLQETKVSNPCSLQGLCYVEFWNTDDWAATSIPPLSRHPRILGNIRLLQSDNISSFHHLSRRLSRSDLFSQVRTRLPQFTASKLMSNSLLSLLAFLLAVLTSSLIAIAQDTYYYRPSTTFRTLLTSPIVTPLNSLLYNSNSSNLEAHGLHPRYQHLLANLPLLLGPALLLLPTIRSSPTPLTALSAASAIIILSIIPHQEARFLLPVVPLILSSVHLSRSPSLTRYWLGAWIAFNALLGVLMGIFHQGGVVPMQMWLSRNHQILAPTASVLDKQLQGDPRNQTRGLQAFWYRTYPPPIWLLDHAPVSTTNLMGIPLPELQQQILTALKTSTISTSSSTLSLPPCDPSNQVALIAPLSSLDLQAWRSNMSFTPPLKWTQLWKYKQHLNLDDLDFGNEERGVFGEIKRVLGKRGLGAWLVGPDCRKVDADSNKQSREDDGGGLVGDW